MGFDSKDLLRQAGYGAGDFVPLQTYDSAANESTASSTYTSSFLAASGIDAKIKWDTYFPASNIHVALSALTSANGDAIDVRVRNITASETLIEETGITGGFTRQTFGPEAYDPTNPSTTDRVVIQIRNDDDTTTVDVQDAVLSIGVVL
jgi:hypothetical protein